MIYLDCTADQFKANVKIITQIMDRISEPVGVLLSSSFSKNEFYSRIRYFIAALLSIILIVVGYYVISKTTPFTDSEHNAAVIYYMTSSIFIMLLLIRNHDYSNEFLRIYMTRYRHTAIKCMPSYVKFLYHAYNFSCHAVAVLLILLQFAVFFMLDIIRYNILATGIIFLILSLYSLATFKLNRLIMQNMYKQLCAFYTLVESAVCEQDKTIDEFAEIKASIMLSILYIQNDGAISIGENPTSIKNRNLEFTGRYINNLFNNHFSPKEFPQRTNVTQIDINKFIISMK